MCSSDLEEHLELEPGSLREALPAQSPRGRPASRRREGLSRFRPGAIDLFNSWQGTLVYAVLLLVLLLALNRQQLLLAQRGLLSVEPMPPEAIPVSHGVAVGAGSGSIAAGAGTRSKVGDQPNPAATASTPSATGVHGPPEPLASAVQAGPIDDLLAAFPELSPLRSAAAGQGLLKLRQERPGPDLSLGRLRLNLSVPTRLNLTSRGGSSAITELRGDLVLPVLPPFALHLEPTPAGPGSVRWNGTALVAGNDGRFRYPPAARP